MEIKTTKLADGRIEVESINSFKRVFTREELTEQKQLFLNEISKIDEMLK